MVGAKKKLNLIVMSIAILLLSTFVFLSLGQAGSVVTAYGAGHTEDYCTAEAYEYVRQNMTGYDFIDFYTEGIYAYALLRSHKEKEEYQNIVIEEELDVSVLRESEDTTKVKGILSMYVGETTETSNITGSLFNVSGGMAVNGVVVEVEAIARFASEITTTQTTGYGFRATYSKEIKSIEDIGTYAIIQNIVARQYRIIKFKLTEDTKDVDIYGDTSFNKNTIIRTDTVKDHSYYAYYRTETFYSITSQYYSCEKIK
ncbi:MAG: hypothetical protein LBT20_01685 [Clostridiales bacterium]|nr:hypothetical protein [Clostridiales bacterium]